MKILANFALIFGFLGFAGFILTILLGFLGCCVGFSQMTYGRIIWIMLAAGVLLFVTCMYHNCYKARK
jgi:hypothetical protein